MRGSHQRWVLPGDFRFEEHEGEWVVLVNDRVVDTGPSLSHCLARVRLKHPREEPFVLKLSAPHARARPAARPE